MNRIVFSAGKWKIKVRDIMLVIIITILLLFALKSCQNDDKKETAIANACNLTGNNLTNLDKLLARADLCSEQWYEDVDDYIKGLEGQNELLKNKKDKQSKKIYDSQTKLLQAVKDFKENQNVETIAALEIQVKDYKEINQIDLNCGKDKK